MFRRVGAGGFKDLKRPDDIGLQVGTRVLDRVAHACLCGEVDNSVGLMGLEKLQHDVSLFDPFLHKGELWISQQRIKARLLEAHVIIVSQCVNADDTPAFGQESFGDSMSDKSS